MNSVASSSTASSVAGTNPARLSARLAPFFTRYEAALQRALAWGTRSPYRASILLILLSIALFSPGVFSRPPIDRTEVRYALSAQSMLETGDWLVPRERSKAKVGRPIGIVWLQSLSAKLAGPENHDAIWAYRLPSFIGAILAVVLLYLGSRSIIGEGAAFCASVLLAHSLFLAVQARLALPQSLALGASVVAQTSLARLYTLHPELSESQRRRAGLAFWAAIGAGIFINSLIVPVLAAVTIAGLYVKERNLNWLRGAGHGLGLVLALLLSAPWFISTWLTAAEAAPDLSILEWLSILIDSQFMHHEAFWGSFILAAWLGLLPVILMTFPVARSVWNSRGVPVMRFLIAWTVPYLLLFELLSDKPPLYMVQYIAPGIAIAMALVLVPNPITGSPCAVPLPVWARVGWMLLAASLAIIPLVLQVLIGEPVYLSMLAASAAVLLLFMTTILAWPHCKPFAATSFSLAGCAVAYWLVMAMMMPGQSIIWPSVRLEEVSDALHPCYPEPSIVAGYSEPSSLFLMGSNTEFAPGAAAARYIQGRRALAFIEDDELADFNRALDTADPARKPVRVACVKGWNGFTSKGGEFLVYAPQPVPNDPTCAVPARYRCQAER